MKRTALLLVTVFLSSAIFLFAGDQNKKNTVEMTGWVCNAKCVDQSSGKATCNRSCSEATGPVVFLDDQGRVFQITNQDKAKPMTGQKGKITAKEDENGRLDLENMLPLPYGP